MNLNEVVAPVSYHNTPDEIKRARMFVCQQGFSVNETKDFLETIGLIPYIPKFRNRDDYGRPIKSESRGGPKRSHHAVG